MRTITDARGVVWEVAPSGRRTFYGSDELSLEFRRVGASPEELRFIRFAPRGARSVEIALEEATDRRLVTMLSQSQPAWTSPDGEYGQSP